MIRYVAFDSETFLIAPGNLTPKPVVFSFAEPNEQPSLMPPDFALRYLESLLTDVRVHLIGANIAFDLGVVTAARPHLMPAVFAAYRAGRIHDVQITQKLIDIAHGCHMKARHDGTTGYSLADLEKHYLHRDRSEDKKNPNAWRLRYRELDGVPLPHWPDDARRYALEDADGTLRVFLAQRELHGTPASEDEQTRAAWALHLMSIQGLRTDGPAVATLKQKLEAERESQLQALREAGFLKPVPLSAEDRRKGVEPDFYETVVKGANKGQLRGMKYSRNMALIKEYVSRAYQGEPPLTEKGAVSTDRDTLERADDPTLRVLAASGATAKLLDTYVPVLERGVHTAINPRFNVLVNSGRTSCGEPNIQNLPRDGAIRDCFTPRPGTVYCSVDYDTLELRCLSQVCLNLFGKSTMAEAIRAGRDLHLQFAAELLGISYEEAVARKKEPEVKEARQFGKIFNFGKPGGLGAATLVEFARTAYGTSMSEQQAREYGETWLRTFPEMRLYFDYISNLVGLGGATVTSMGNGMVRGDVGYCDGANHFFQNLAAQGAKAACFDVAEECYIKHTSPLYGTRPVAFIHDEIVAEVPVERAHAASKRMAEVMCAAMARVVPDVPVTASPALMRKWLKGAEAVYDDAGVLIPWEPSVIAA